MTMVNKWFEDQLVTARAEGYAQGVEDAAGAVDVLHGWPSPESVARTIRALAPVAPVIPAPARTYEDGMRDAAGIRDLVRGIIEIAPDIPKGLGGYTRLALSTTQIIERVRSIDAILAAAGNPPTVGDTSENG